MTLSAVEDAMSDSNLKITSTRDCYRTGVMIGSSLGSLNCITDSISKAIEGGYVNINRMLMLRMLINLLSSNISIKYNLKGPMGSPTLACATGLNAIGDSFRLIESNEADIMICGGSEASIHPLVFHSMNKLNTLCNDVTIPEQSSRPFDLNRKGFVIGEGSGILILEELQHALDRKAKIYCEIKSYSSFGDANHLTRPADDGEGGFRAMMKCLVDANITPYEVDMINCHATSTETGDKSELNAVMNLFGNEEYREIEKLKEDFENFNFKTKLESLCENRLKEIYLCANKSQMGHLLAAAGAVELGLLVLSIKNNTIVRNMNIDDPITRVIDLNFQDCEKKMNYALKNSFAFGGVNSSILIKNVSDELN